MLCRCNSSCILGDECCVVQVTVTSVVAGSIIITAVVRVPASAFNNSEARAKVRRCYITVPMPHYIADLLDSDR